MSVDVMQRALLTPAPWHDALCVLPDPRDERLVDRLAPDEWRKLPSRPSAYDGLKASHRLVCAPIRWAGGQTLACTYRRLRAVRHADCQITARLAIP